MVRTFAVVIPDKSHFICFVVSVASTNAFDESNFLASTVLASVAPNKVTVVLATLTLKNPNEELHQISPFWRFVGFPARQPKFTPALVAFVVKVIGAVNVCRVFRTARVSAVLFVIGIVIVVFDVAAPPTTL